MVAINGAIPLSDMAYFPNTERIPQAWKEVRPELDSPIILIIAPTPWTIIFDFQLFDPSDLATLRVESEFTAPDGQSSRWVLMENYEIGVDGRAGHHLLTVNGEVVGPQKVALITPVHGPWVSKLTYVHNRSSTKPVRYMRLPTA